METPNLRKNLLIDCMVYMMCVVQSYKSDYSLLKFSSILWEKNRRQANYEKMLFYLSLLAQLLQNVKVFLHSKELFRQEIYLVHFSIFQYIRSPKCSVFVVFLYESDLKHVVVILFQLFLFSWTTTPGKIIHSRVQPSADLSFLSFLSLLSHAHNLFSVHILYIGCMNVFW